ncbi:hypothetical protein EDB81DRAFT_803402 [Dactylonectria macrodidyma]|uniref:Uncharacterized protein n=1 Tax=Dactylonectria macrodidyma TaxID=307937 RepID=A0A9P9ECU0_9HYPO|nr:hypothetical protein EDB81DRAFT_803402 [Dactylonectria macrodidyma]
MEQRLSKLLVTEQLSSEQQLLNQPLHGQPLSGQPSVRMSRPQQPSPEQPSTQPSVDMPWGDHPLLNLPMFDLDENEWLDELDRFIQNPAEAHVYASLTPPPDSDPQPSFTSDASAYSKIEVDLLDAILPPDNSTARQPQPVAAQPQPRRSVPPATFRYQGHITSRGEAATLRSTYNPFPDPSGGMLLDPVPDPTMPQNDDEYCARIEEIFTAICDWSDLAEWRTRMGRENVKAWLAEVAASKEAEGSDVDVFELKDDQIRPPAERMPSIDEQWINVTHREMDNFTIELLCTQILDEAVLAQKGLNQVPL